MKIFGKIVCGFLSLCLVFSGNVFASGGIEEFVCYFAESVEKHKGLESSEEFTKQLDLKEGLTKNMNLRKYNEVYSRIFDKVHNGCCRVSTAAICSKLSKLGIENFELVMKLGRRDSAHCATLYRYKGKWYVADLTLSRKNYEFGLENGKPNLPKENIYYSFGGKRARSEMLKRTAIVPLEIYIVHMKTYANLKSIDVVDFLNDSDVPCGTVRSLSMSKFLSSYHTFSEKYKDDYDLKKVFDFSTRFYDAEELKVRDRKFLSLVKQYGFTKQQADFLSSVIFD